MMRDLPSRALLGAADVDRLNEMIHILLAEVVVLSERVTSLESAGTDQPSNSQQRIDEFTARVLHPFIR